MKNNILKLLFLLFFAHIAFSQNSVTTKTTFICPPCGGSCDELLFEKAGKCPHCGMTLVDKNTISTANKSTEKNISICFYLQDNVELLDFAGPMEVFIVAGFDVFTVSKTKDKIISQGVLTITPDYSIEDAPASDMMAFFGGAHAKPTNDTAVISWIQSRIPKTEYFLSVCTGAFILGKAGVLDGLSATTYHTQIEDLRQALPKTKVLENVRFVDNGKVISTAGISAGIDGALHFIAKIKGEDFAKKVAADIEYDTWIPNQGLILEVK